MAKLIALRSGTEYTLFPSQNGVYTPILKQQALLFDQIGILFLDAVLNESKTLEDNPEHHSFESTSFLLDLKWLQQIGIIFGINVEDFETQAEEGKPEFTPQLTEQITDLWINAANRLQKAIDLGFDVKNISNRTNTIIETDAILLRLISLVLGAKDKDAIVTTLPYYENVPSLSNSAKSDVAQIVINKLPLPNNETPWEQIIDYRNDPENQKSLLALRRWIRKTSTQNLSGNEIEEELEWLINEFQNHMKIHKMRANTETLEVMVKTPLEIIENLIKLKLSKIPEPLFAIKKRQINLMEAELNAPGRELAYIIKTRDTFQSNE